MRKYSEYANDKTSIKSFTARSGNLMLTEQDKVEQSLLQTNVPFIFIEAEKDDVVNNACAKAHFEKTKAAGKRNEYVVIHGEDTNHTLVSIDPVLGCEVMNHVVRFFDKLIKEKEQKT